MADRKNLCTEIYIIGDNNSTQSSNSNESAGLDLSYDSDEELLPLNPKTTKACSKPAQPMISSKMKAVIFINIFCVFDTCDNINAKSAMVKGVSFMDLAFSRIAMNFISACFLVYFFKQKVLTSIPSEFRKSLVMRSLMMTASQTLNCFAIQLLPISMMTIV